MISRTLHYFWQVTRPYKRAMVVVMLFVAMGVASGSIGYYFLLSQIVDKLGQVSANPPLAHDLWILLGGLAAMAILEFTSWRIVGFKTLKQQTSSLRELEALMFKNLMRHSYSFFTNRFAGSLVTQFNRYLRSYENLEDVFLFEVYPMLIRISFAVTILFLTASWIGWALLLWTIFFVVSVGWLSYKKMPYSKRAAAADSKVTGEAADAITNVLTIKMFARHQHEHDRFAATSFERFKARGKSWLFDEFIRTYQSLLMTIFQVAIIYFSIRFVIDGTITVAIVLLAQLYISRIFADLWNLQNVIRRTESAFSDANEMTQILELPHEVKDPRSPKTVKISKGKIVFKAAAFKYGKRDKHVFNKFSLTIKPGEKIGLVGHSGGGKTTLTKLLLRFADLQAGQILIDNQDIAKLRQEDLRAHIAYVPQEPILFHRSLMENIRYGRLDATDEEVFAAAKLAHAQEFIDQLPDGYETLVGERGIKLSGGQKQRVAIARAMLSRAPILILDEATSSLDSVSEKYIAQALIKLMENRTTIVIAHRLSTIQKMDRIVVLEDGEIAEQGTHKQLLASKGKYAELWGHQSGGFLED